MAERYIFTAQRHQLDGVQIRWRRRPTRRCATHKIALARPIADFFVSFGADGRIRGQGSISELTKRGPLAAAGPDPGGQTSHAQGKTGDGAENPVTKSAGKLIVVEEIQLGHVLAPCSSPALKE